MKRKTRKTIAGTGQAAMRAREEKFIAVMLANGENQTQAAIAAGYSKKTAENAGYTVVRRPRVKAELARRKKEILKKYELTPERVLREVGRIAYFDAAKCFNKNGTLKSIHAIDEDTRRAIAQMKDGEIKPFDKNNALGRAMQYLGLLPKPGLSLKAQMSIAAAEVQASEPQEQQSMLEIARRIVFVLNMGAEMAQPTQSAKPKPKTPQPQPA